MRAADYITKKKGLDWTDNTIGGVYNLRQQLRTTKPTLPKTTSQQQKQPQRRPPNNDVKLHHKVPEGTTF